MEAVSSSGAAIELVKSLLRIVNKLAFKETTEKHQLWNFFEAVTFLPTFSAEFTDVLVALNCASRLAKQLDRLRKDGIKPYLAQLMDLFARDSIRSGREWLLPVFESRPAKTMGSRAPSSSGRATCKAESV